MVTRKPRIVIIGAGIAGLTAANKLYKSAVTEDFFELCIVEGGQRIGGRINTSEFCGDRIEMGATWIHGIGGSPIHQIAQETNSLESEQPWECMDSFSDFPVTIAEGGYKLNPSLVEPIYDLFNTLMDFATGKLIEDGLRSKYIDFAKFMARSSNGFVNGGNGSLSIGSFLRQGLDAYWDSREESGEAKLFSNWSQKELEEAIFAMYENEQRTYTAAGDLNKLDYSAESEYIMFPGEEITIAKGYSSVIESLASVLPSGTIQLGKRVTRIEWQPDGYEQPLSMENGEFSRPVKLHFADGATMLADHVIVTVSLGVLKQGIQKDSDLFNPPLPSFKTQAISRLGFGVVNKLFLQIIPTENDQDRHNSGKFPSLQMVFHQTDHPKVPWWMRRTNSLSPIYQKSSVLLTWFAGKEALELESLNDEDIIKGVSSTISNFLSDAQWQSNGTEDSAETVNQTQVKFSSVLKTQWGNDPLFLGSYSYVAVGSSGEDLDTMAEPLPKISNTCCRSSGSPPLLQLLFAGEATHRTHYSTTHGAYFSGLREANRLLQHYKCGGGL